MSEDKYLEVVPHPQIAQQIEVMESIRDELVLIREATETKYEESKLIKAELKRGNDIAEKELRLKAIELQSLPHMSPQTWSSDNEEFLDAVAEGRTLACGQEEEEK